uniref:G0/G1 switch 2 n=1 Tax=Cyprinus carpio TaxID=7962 RepID=A0A8C1W0H3_CYPCA
MEKLRELVLFIREVLRQKPSRGLLKVYLVGSLLAVLGSVLGLLELLFQPFIHFIDRVSVSTIEIIQCKNAL